MWTICALLFINPFSLLFCSFFYSWWRHQMEIYPRYWPFVKGIHRSLLNSRHKGQWRGALMFSLICASTNGCTNNLDAGDLIGHRAHYDVTAMIHSLCGYRMSTSTVVARRAYDCRSVSEITLENIEYTWWRHQMETFSALLTICAGNSPITGEFPTQRPVTRSFDVYFDLPE